MNNMPLFGESRLDYQDNWTLYWLSYVPFEQYLEKWIHAKTRWETYWKKVKEGETTTKLLPRACNHFKQKQLHVGIFGIFPPSFPFFLPSPPSRLLFPGFYSAKADVVIYCGHPSLVLIHHRPVARRSWQQLFAFEFNRGAVSQRRQVKSITNAVVTPNN